MRHPSISAYVVLSAVLEKARQNHSGLKGTLLDATWQNSLRVGVAGKELFTLNSSEACEHTRVGFNSGFGIVIVCPKEDLFERQRMAT